MDPNDIRTLFAYHTWASGRVLETAASIADVQFAAPSDFPHSSLRGTLVHLVNHGTQHCSEAAALLTRYGFSPGDLDMIRFFRRMGRGKYSGDKARY